MIVSKGGKVLAPDSQEPLYHRERIDSSRGAGLGRIVGVELLGNTLQPFRFSGDTVSFVHGDETEHPLISNNGSSSIGTKRRNPTARAPPLPPPKLGRPRKRFFSPKTKDRIEIANNRRRRPSVPMPNHLSKSVVQSSWACGLLDLLGKQ